MSADAQLYIKHDTITETVSTGKIPIDPVSNTRSLKARRQPAWGHSNIASRYNAFVTINCNKITILQSFFTSMMPHHMMIKIFIQTTHSATGRHAQQSILHISGTETISRPMHVHFSIQLCTLPPLEAVVSHQEATVSHRKLLCCEARRLY